MSFDKKGVNCHDSLNLMRGCKPARALSLSYHDSLLLFWLAPKQVDAFDCTRAY